MTIQEYIALFEEETTKQLPQEQAQEVARVLSEGTPRKIFLELDRLREAGALQGSDVEKALTDFYWQFCY